MRLTFETIHIYVCYFTDLVIHWKNIIIHILVCDHIVVKFVVKILHPSIHLKRMKRYILIVNETLLVLIVVRLFLPNKILFIMKEHTLDLKIMYAKNVVSVNNYNHLRIFQK